MMPKHENEDKEVKVKTAGILISEDIFEEIELSNGIYSFAIWEKQVNGDFKLRIAPLYGVSPLYIPLDKVPWLCAKEPLEYLSEIDLWNEVKQFVIDHWDYWDSRIYDIITGVIFSSWIIEAVNVVNYLFFLGPPATGKTRGLEVLYFLARRSILGSSFSPASLARAVEAYEPFLLLDEAEILQKESMQEAIGILNSGYRRGSFYIRARKEENGNMELEMVKTFGYKAFSGTRQLTATLEDRNIILSMRETKKKLNDIWSHPSQELAKNLRSCLLMYRFKKLTNWVKGEPFEAFEGLEGILEKLQSHRLRELFQNLIAVSPSEEIRNTIMDYALSLEKNRKEEKYTGLDAEIVQAIVQLYDSDPTIKTIAIKTVTETINQEREENDSTLTNMTVGLVTKTLGFQKTRIHGGSTAIKIDLEHIESLRATYVPSNGEEKKEDTPLRVQSLQSLHPFTLEPDKGSE